MKCARSGLWFVLLCGFSLLLALALALAREPEGRAPVDEGAPVLLASAFGELCTMCIGYLRCAPQSPPADETFDLYYFRERGFWAQLATLWEWGAALFGAEPPPHARRLVIYRQQRDDKGAVRRSVLHDQAARLDLAAASIELPDGRVDRRDGSWFDAKGNRIGTCTRVLPLPAQALSMGFQ